MRTEHLNCVDCAHDYVKVSESDEKGYINVLCLNSNCKNRFDLSIDYLLDNMNPDKDLEHIDKPKEEDYIQLHRFLRFIKQEQSKEA